MICGGDHHGEKDTTNHSTKTLAQTVTSDFDTKIMNGMPKVLSTLKLPIRAIQDLILVAPASILSASRWPKCRFKNSVVMVGLPQHIAIGYLRISSDMAMFEFFDPAGPTGDKEGVKELKKWTEKKLPKRIGKPVQFHQVHRND